MVPPLNRCYKSEMRVALILLAVGLLLPDAGSADSRDRRALSFLSIHNGARVDVVYWDSGTYVPEGLAVLNGFLRDRRTGDEHTIDPALFDLLHELRLPTGTREPFQVISGYRSPQTNARLQEQGRGVASGSLHMQGRAIDIRLSDVPLTDLRDAALKLQRGGVGFYSASDFVHVDTGRVRQW